ncbi:hypothetical protein EYW49_03490 [Siculibacillus lacustris]|uniref:L,D-TPase catalytic domain-containing protein n=1 Tax=Siculibacillus lacustris TaxID=1549641 RepID=A0A4Q9VWT5_9HYPH|nr:L,D-transpeptidase family protein [Siculibacillus lacustris]TBW40802.1 hypothetical protein EYW49_03490 [Siculibacillus lacustris]
MKAIGWSSLLLGTILATGLAPATRAEEALAPSAQDRIDALTTGSIAPLGGAPSGGLVPPGAAASGSLRELTAPAGTPPALIPPREAPATPAPAVSGQAETQLPEPVRADAAPAPVAAEPVPTAAATPASDSAPVTAEVAPAPIAAEAAAAAPAVAVAAPAEPAAPAVVATEPTPVEPAVSTPAVATTEPSAPVTDAVASAPAAEPPPAAAAEPTAHVAPPVAETAAAPTPSSPPTEAVATTIAAPAPTPEPPAAVVPPASPVETTASTPVAVAPVAAPPSHEPTAPARLAAVDAPAPATAVEAPADPALRTAELAEAAASDALRAALDALHPLGGSAEERADRSDVAAFYQARGHRFLFGAATGPTPVAVAALDRLAHADRDGLEPNDYATPALVAGLAPEARAKAEIAVATTVVRYARHLQTGRFAPGRVSELVTPRTTKTSAADVLKAVASAADAGAALAAYAPPHLGYQRLKAALADLRGTAVRTPTVQVPIGPPLKPGQRNERVALLRERLGVAPVATDATIFDPALGEAVKAFQRDRGLVVNGTVGRDTVVALNDPTGGNADKIADVVVNMERWRWLPRDLGTLHVFVNIPDFHLDVMKDGRSILHSKVITGRPENQTPLFSEMMQYVVVNPYWNVPISIIRKEMLSKAQATNGGSLTRGNYEVAVGNRTVDPATVDWAAVPAEQVEIRQRPGDGNALGNIKFMFPNQHSVYIHDTSSRGLFAQAYRALSHGCVRVFEPFAFADAVLSEEPTKLDGARLKAMLGGGEKFVNLKRFVPVHIAYFTQWVDDDGHLQARRDIYSHDARMKRLLGL